MVTGSVSDRAIISSEGSDVGVKQVSDSVAPASEVHVSEALVVNMFCEYQSLTSVCGAGYHSDHVNGTSKGLTSQGVMSDEMVSGYLSQDDVVPANDSHVSAAAKTSSVVQVGARKLYSLVV